MGLLSVYSKCMVTLSSYTSRPTATPAEVYALWVDPAVWPTWDPEVASVEFTGAVKLGARGILTPSSGPRSGFIITDLEPERVLTNSGRLPGAHLDFIHEVSPIPSGSELTVTVRTRGPLSGLWGLILKRAMSSAASSSAEGAVAFLESRE